MKDMRRTAFFLFLSLLFIKVLFAQDTDCAALTQQIIESSRQACMNIDINEICYGNGAIEAKARQSNNLTFNHPGDTADLATIAELQIHGTSDDFAVAIARTRANLPDAALTLTAFGDLSLENTSNKTSTYFALDAIVRSSEGANIRFTPSTGAEIVGQLRDGEEIIVDGRLADSSWVRVFPTFGGGWLSSDLIDSNLDLELLEIVPGDPIPGGVDYPYGPLQSFHFRVDYPDDGCSAMPSSGILIQTPDSAQPVSLMVNGLELEFTGTIYLQTDISGKTIISVLEGQLNPIGFPLLLAGQQEVYWFQEQDIQFSLPEDYNYARARYLPLQLLSREFELPFSLGGVVFPFTPGTGFLNGIAADAACTVAWTVDVNIRSGPGTNYPIRKGISGGYYGLPDARAVGTDGAVWWRLLDGIWLAANNTAAGGACGTLPLVEPPPLPTTP